MTRQGSDDYAYDANGNMTSRDYDGGTQYLSYNPENWLTHITATLPVTLTYDAEGNLCLSKVGVTETVHIG